MDAVPLSCRVTDEASGRSIDASVIRVGTDIVITIGGGSQPHVGVIVVSQPDPRNENGRTGSPSSTIVTIPPHKEEAIARPVAEAVCRATGCTTVVTAGVHEDKLDSDGIRNYLELARRLAEKLLEHLRPANGESAP